MEFEKEIIHFKTSGEKKTTNFFLTFIENMYREKLARETEMFIIKKRKKQREGERESKKGKREKEGKK